MDAACLEDLIGDCSAVAFFFYHAAAHDVSVQGGSAVINNLCAAALQGGDRADAAAADGLGAAAHGDDRAHAAAGVEIADVLPAAVHGADRSAGARVYRLDAAVHARDRARAAAEDDLGVALVHTGNGSCAATEDFLLGCVSGNHGGHYAHATGGDYLLTVQDFHGTGGGGAGNYLNTGTPYADDRGRAARGHVDGAGGKGVGVVNNRDAIHHPQRAAGESIVPIAHGRAIRSLKYGTVMNFQHAPRVLRVLGGAARRNDLGTAHAGADVYRGAVDDGAYRQTTGRDNLHAAAV